MSPRNLRRARAVRKAAAGALAFAACLFARRVAFAADDAANAVTTEPCQLAHFAGKLVSSVSPKQCSVARCSRAREVKLVDASENPVFGVEASESDDDPEPPVLACDGGALVLRWLGQALHFEFHGGVLRLAFGDRRYLGGLWQAPAARAASDVAAHESLARLLELAFAGTRRSDLPPPVGLDSELVRLVELVPIRDELRAGAFELADARITGLERAQATALESLPPALFAHVRELRHELDATRRRTLPLSLGPRRFVGGAERPLSTPLDVGDAPQLFFRGGELCVVEVAPVRSPQPDALAGAEDRMRCFAPNATSPRETEPLALPASSAAKLGSRELTSPVNRCRTSRVVLQKPLPEVAPACDGGPAVAIEDLLAVVEGDAMLAVANGGLELIRAGVRQKISPLEARSLVTGSAGSRFFARTASYFLTTRRIAQVAGGENRTWDVLGKPPGGAFWVGTPLVSPDQRWVVAQSGNGTSPVSLWVFALH